jgi:hypothetical protein
MRCILPVYQDTSALGPGKNHSKNQVKETKNGIRLGLESVLDNLRRDPAWRDMVRQTLQSKRAAKQTEIVDSMNCLLIQAIADFQVS